jgi:hypothetical protein
MPYPSEHSCRLRDPGAFEKDSFRRIASGKVSMIIGKLKGHSETTAQAIRYPKDKWTAAEARADCAKHKGQFEAAASGQAQEMELPDHLDPAKNPYIKLDEE